MSKAPVLAPASLRQEMFLNSKTDITLGGGAKGGGKTFTSLLIALKYMQDPHATGIIFRRTSTDMKNPGSIWDEAVSMYSMLYGTGKGGIKIRTRDMEIIFPTGGKLKFSHLQYEKDVLSHKGGQYSLVIFDEATDFSEYQITFLLGRMRNAKVTQYSPKMFLMTNPEYNHFLRKWIEDYYLDQNTGIPIQENAGDTRYMVRNGNNIHWFNDKTEANTFADALFGVDNKSTEEGNGVRSFSFIPFTIYDNPPLMKNDPNYLSNLKALPRVEKEKYLYGSWFARVEASQMWKREWVQIVPHANGRAVKRVRSYDIAFTRPSEQNPSPDWTRGVLISKDKLSVYTVEDVVSIRDRVHEVERLIFETAIRDGQEVTITIPKDPNASAGAYAKDLQRRLGDMGFHVVLVPPVKSKVTRFAPFASVTQAGFVNVVEADWNKDFFEELEVFTGDGKKKDDQVDSCSDSFSTLNRGYEIPDFSVSNLQSLSSASTLPSFGFNGSSSMDFPLSNSSIPTSGLTLA